LILHHAAFRASGARQDDHVQNLDTTEPPDSTMPHLQPTRLMALRQVKTEHCSYLPRRPAFKNFKLEMPATKQ
jgi:hypothetical protein